MIRRRFGKTGLDLSVLSLGAMRIPPEDGEEPAQHHDRVMATLRSALDAGINHIETARGYGPSEALIGQALREGVIHRNEFVLTTKIGPNDSADAFRRDLDDSMQRMGVDLVDNLDIHGINLTEHVATCTRTEGCMAAVRRAMDEGIVGHIGFSTHGPLEVILEAIGTDLFESVNLHYYYFNQRNRPAVLRAAEMDMGVYIISPTDKGGLLFDPPQRLIDLCAPYSPIELNERWLLAQPEVHTLSLGAARPTDLDAHLPAAMRDASLCTEERAAVDRLDGATAVLGDTYCSFCHACLPCPEDVHIPEVLRLRNMALAYDMAGFGRYRYNMLVRRDAATGERTGGASHWFPGAQGDFCTACGDCLPRCPLHLDVPALLADTHSILTGEARKRLWE